MIDPVFLEPDVVHFLHDQAIREYGGIHGLQDQALLDSALSRPVHKLTYAEPEADFFDLAASYAFGIACNHQFHDCNKRTAWGCCVLFLKANGMNILVPPAEAVEQMLRLAYEGLGEIAFAARLRRHSDGGMNRGIQRAQKA